MSRHHDSRDRDAHRRRRNDDHTDDKTGQSRPTTHDRRDRDDHQQSHHHQHQRSGSDQGGSRRQPPVAEQRRDEPPHDRRREDAGNSSHRNAFVKREHSRSPDTKAKRHRNRYANESTDDGSHEWGMPSIKTDPSARAPGAATNDEAAGPVEKEQPNFGLSGKLTEDTNKVNGIVLKYSEPDEARKPKRRWRLYPFKGDQTLPTLFIHRQSCFLIGRDRKICDIPVDHPSCSKQHAVLQYRLVGYTRDDGTKGKRVRPYVLDLESANGTYLNNERIASKKYVEVLEKDVIKFGYSSREYVMLHENSRDEEEDDDVVEEPEEPKKK